MNRVCRAPPPWLERLPGLPDRQDRRSVHRRVLTTSRARPRPRSGRRSTLCGVGPAFHFRVPGRRPGAHHVVKAVGGPAIGGRYELSENLRSIDQGRGYSSTVRTARHPPGSARAHRGRIGWLHRGASRPESSRRSRRRDPRELSPRRRSTGFSTRYSSSTRSRPATAERRQPRERGAPREMGARHHPGCRLTASARHRVRLPKCAACAITTRPSWSTATPRRVDDCDISDRSALEPLTLEDVLEVYRASARLARQGHDRPAVVRLRYRWQPTLSAPALPIQAQRGPSTWRKTARIP